MTLHANASLLDEGKAIIALLIYLAFWENRMLRQNARSENPLRILDVLDRYCVKEYGSLYIYVPTLAESSSIDDVSVWLEALRAAGVLRGGPWMIDAKWVREAVKRRNRHLFVEVGANSFTVYRIDCRSLNKFIAAILSNTEHRRQH